MVAVNAPRPFIISIHAPRGGSDVFCCSMYLMQALFQSTLPVGGATGFTIAQQLVAKISIHAPRGGSDVKIYQQRQGVLSFQSTLPVGGATIVV